MDSIFKEMTNEKEQEFLKTLAKKRTKEDIIAYSSDSFTYMDKWSDKLMSLSIPTELIKISTEDLKKIVDHAYNGDEDSYPKSFKVMVHKALKGRKMFYKLNSRSTKDFNDCILSDAGGIINSLCGSMRTTDDIMMFLSVKKDCFLCLREVQDIPQEREFRVFVKGGVIQGISEYFYTNDAIKWINGNSLKIEYAVTSFVKSIRHTIPKEDFVIDVWLKDFDDIVVIEINPYGKSDPCHFKSYENIEKAGGRLVFNEIKTTKTDIKKG